MGKIKEGRVPSALEMSEEMSGAGEPGTELLPRSPPEAPALPMFKNHLVAVNKIKMQQRWVP